MVYRLFCGDDGPNPSGFGPSRDSIVSCRPLSTQLGNLVGLVEVGVGVGGANVGGGVSNVGRGEVVVGLVGFDVGGGWTDVGLPSADVGPQGFVVNLGESGVILEGFDESLFERRDVLKEFFRLVPLASNVLHAIRRI